MSATHGASVPQSEAHAVADICYLLRRSQEKYMHLYMVLDATSGISSVFQECKRPEQLEIKIEGFGKAPLRLLQLGPRHEDVLRESVEQYRLARSHQRRSQVVAWVVTQQTLTEVGAALRRLLENEKRSGTKERMRIMDSLSLPHWSYALSEQQRHMLACAHLQIACLNLSAELCWTTLPEPETDGLRMHARGAFKQRSVNLVNEAAKVLNGIGVQRIDIQRAHAFAESIITNVPRRNVLDQVLLLAHDIAMDCELHHSPIIIKMLSDTAGHETALAQAMGKLDQMQLAHIRDSVATGQGGY